MEENKKLIYWKEVSTLVPRRDDSLPSWEECKGVWALHPKESRPTRDLQGKNVKVYVG